MEDQVPPLSQEKMEQMNAAWERRFARREPVTEIDQDYVSAHVETVTEEQALIRGVNDNLAKLYRQVQNDMDRQLKLPMEQAKKVMNEVMKAYGFGASNYRLDQTNIAHILNQMILWAMYDPACEWDVDKGIYLWGDVGRGKTQLMKFFSGFTKAIDFRHAEIVHVKSIVIDVSEAKNLGPLKRYLKGKWIFNDIGTEEDDRLMGNKIDLVDRVFKIRADDDILTHATGNVPRTEINKVYGRRIDSVWDQLFNTVHVSGPWDFRKSDWRAGFINK